MRVIYVGSIYTLYDAMANNIEHEIYLIKEKLATVRILIQISNDRDS